MIKKGEDQGCEVSEEGPNLHGSVNPAMKPANGNPVFKLDGLPRYLKMNLYRRFLFVTSLQRFGVVKQNTKNKSRPAPNHIACIYTASSVGVGLRARAVSEENEINAL